MNFISADKKTIHLPIALGEAIYEVHTTCNDACSKQSDKLDIIFPPKQDGRCSREMPCHTKVHSILEANICLGNLERIIRDWGTYCFASREEAEVAGEKIVQAHQEELVSLGITV